MDIVDRPVEGTHREPYGVDYVFLRLMAGRTTGPIRPLLTFPWIRWEEGAARRVAELAPVGIRALLRTSEESMLEPRSFERVLR